MPVNWSNPYKHCGTTWIKGNLHAHFAPQSPCAAVSPQDLIEAYSRKGYAFLGISNHLCLPEEESLAAEAQTLTLPGMEWNSRTPYMEEKALTYQDHYGIYTENKKTLRQCLSARTPADMLAVCRQDATAFSVLHHPNWLFPAHAALESLLFYAPRVHGLEIYNAGLEREPGNALATHTWDTLLGSGIRLLGVVGDDSHRIEDIGKAWLVVSVDCPQGITIQTVLMSLLLGRFYCSTGVYFDSVQRNGDTLSATAGEECRLRIVTDFGAVAHEVMGKTIEWTFKGGCTYARITADGKYGAQAWTQPFFAR